jgi:hypothetical protein
LSRPKRSRNEAVEPYEEEEEEEIIGCFRYVDDILLICNRRKPNLDEILAEFNEQQPTVKFTAEKELTQLLNFLIFQYIAGENRSNLQYTENPLRQIS